MSLFLEVKFKGGLGNQLFQYATARCLSVRNRTSQLLFNTDNYRIDAFGRDFGLTNFRVKGRVIHSGLAKKIFQKGTKYNKIVSLLPLYSGIEEEGLRLHRFPTRLRLLSSLSGYWQSEYYFKEIRELLVEEVVPRQIPPFPGWMEGSGSDEWVAGSETVAVHIRRTDYLVENGFGSLPVRYYQEAIESIRSRVERPVFVFFSDDLDWCRGHFRESGFRFCDDRDWQADYLQLFLMSRCKHQIIANSSFSWWGAWLNANPDRCVIRPERPFLDDSLRYESYYPSDWTALRN
jgi:hypothetical protein